MPVTAFSSTDPSILSNGTVIVDFSAVWCGPCKKYAPEFEKLALEKKFSMMTFVKVDIDEHESLGKKYEINSLPTTLVLVNGKEMARCEGYDLQEICDMLDKFLDPNA